MPEVGLQTADEIDHGKSSEKKARLIYFGIGLEHYLLQLKYARLIF